jgi:TolA-binding protein
MNENELQELLREADQQSALSGLSDDLVERVRKKVRRRRRNKRRVTTVIVLLLCVSAVGLWRPKTKTETKEMNQVAVLQTDVRRLKEEINARMAFLEKILDQQEQRNRLAALERKLAAIGDPLEKMKRQADKTALVIYYYANRKLTELNLEKEAVAEFQQVIRLFPESIWAEKSQEKLQQRLVHNSR